MAGRRGTWRHDLPHLDLHRPRPPTRQEALELCNSWNRSHRWPKAFVMDRGDSWRIILRADIDLEPGVPRALFEVFTKRVAAGMVEFWQSTGAGRDTPGAERDLPGGGGEGPDQCRSVGSDG